MNRESLLAFHDKICADARKIMEAKNHDYAGGEGESPFANFESTEALGITSTALGMCVRMGDKPKRLITYAKTGKLMVPGEGFEDACVDLINYSVLFAARELDRKK